MNNDLISREALKKAVEELKRPKAYSEADVRQNVVIDCVLHIINNAPTVEYPFYQEAYQTGYEEGKNERPQGSCENCDFRKFSEKFVDGFVDGFVDLMNKNGITSVEQLSEILKGGTNG